MSKYFLEQVMNRITVCQVDLNANYYRIENNDNVVVDFLNKKIDLIDKYKFSTIKNAPSSWLNILNSSDVQRFINEM